MSAEQQTNREQAEQILSRLVNDGGNVSQLAADCFGWSDLLPEQPVLLRSLTDPGRSSGDRQQLISDIIAADSDNKDHSDIEKLLRELVGMHWSDPTALIELVNLLGVQATLTIAAQEGRLTEVEEELFGLSKLLGEQRDLRVQLSQLGVGDRAQRGGFIARLLTGVVSAVTLILAERAVVTSRHGRLLQTLRQYSEESARLHGANLVTATVAAPLSEEQFDRLQKLASRQAGRAVVLTVAVDPNLIGGFRLTMGDNSVDTSIRSDIAEARRVLTR